MPVVSEDAVAELSEDGQEQVSQETDKVTEASLEERKVESVDKDVE